MTIRCNCHARPSTAMDAVLERLAAFPDDVYDDPTPETHARFDARVLDAALADATTHQHPGLYVLTEAQVSRLREIHEMFTQWLEDVERGTA